MRPTLAAQALRDTTVEYLATTFALAEPDTQDALTAFLTDPVDGLFRGPYLRLRRPFRPAEDGWQRHLDWWSGPWPYAHQADAFARLTSKDGHVPQPTLVTTGTGSGKTESFLIPVLDHCQRARAAGRLGVKAVLLYPMNALAGDQAGRLGDLLEDPRLMAAGVTAGLYIGEASASRGGSPYGRVMVDRAEIRRNPPDILITNYKMLDLLLQRQQDAPLWQDADLAYIVIDEFHTYDGAQGTDVAMLLRRLARVVGASGEGRPLGSICPVATSATLGSGGDSEPRERTGTTSAAASGADGGPGGLRAMLDVASQVFGVRFPDDAVIGEERQPLEDFLAPLDLTLPLPAPDELVELPDPSHTADGLHAIARATVDCDATDRRELGRRLLAHPLAHALLKTDPTRPLTTAEALAGFDPTSPWRAAAVRDPRTAATALARFVALISEARHPDAPADVDRPLLLVETHLWLRSLSRVLRYVSPEPEFSWSDADQAAATGAASGGPADAAASADRQHAGRQAVVRAAQEERRRHAQRAGRLPAAYCRHCGRSGWAAVCPNRNPAELEHVPEEIWRRSAAGGAVKGRVRALIAATPARAAEQAREMRKQLARRGRRRAQHDATVLVLEDSGRKLRRLDPDEVLLDDGTIAEAPENGVYVQAWFDNQEQDDYSRQDRCPACGQAQGIRFLGAGVAPLASVVVTQLFTGGELPAKDEEVRDRRRTLIFNDSVQDAAHRAGFVASRSWKFSLRSLIHQELARRTGQDPAAAEDGVPLNELIASLITRAAEPDGKVLVSVVPPDLHDVDRVKALLEGKKRISEPTWELVGERLAFQTLLEFGLSSRLGRTLELTRTVAAEVHLPDPVKTAETAQALYDTQQRQLRLRPDARDPEADREERGAEADASVGGPSPAETLPQGPDRLRYFEGYVRGLLEHVRQSGGIRHNWLKDFIDSEGTDRRSISFARPSGMPAFGRGSEAPAFVLVGSRSGRTDFERVSTRDSWFVDFTMRCLGLERDDAIAYLGELLPRLSDPDIGALAHRRTSDAGQHRGQGQGHGVYGLTPGHIRVRPLTAEETARSALTCPVCGWTQTVPPQRVPVWQGMRCPLKQCDGALTVPSLTAQGRAARDHRYDYYRRLYSTTDPYSVIAAEHTGVLKRKEREAVEKGFRRGIRTDPNVLSCTPTLELGIDIGQLEAVVLASLPPSTAGYIQRAGRAGRATGNAFTISLADTSPRALYHLAEPRDLIAGPILPPGCFLSAAELLRRQYTAHLLDLAARGRLEGVTPLPDRVTQLVGRTGWLRTTARAVIGRTDLVESFLSLFAPVEGVPDSGVSDEARAALTTYAGSGLAARLVEAEEAWQAERAALLDRRDMIAAAADDLQDNIDDEAREKRNLQRDARGFSQRLQELSHAGAQAFLVEQGLLPNYTLVENGVRLEAMLTYKEPARPRRGDAQPGEQPPRDQWRNEPRVYDRPAESALTELAPGNAYYVLGYRHVVDGFDLGPRPKGEDENTPAALRAWRVCRECGHVRTENAEQDRSACPRCGGRDIGGSAALHHVIVPTKVTARDKRDDARIIDDSENRTNNPYTIVTAVDIDPEGIKGTWRHRNTTFGVDHVREAVIRSFNLGRARHGRRNDTIFAGAEVTVTGFTLCPLCGGASDREMGDTPAPDTLSVSAMGKPELAHHRPWCVTRRRSRAARPDDQRIITATEHRTEALRILLPAATLNVPERLASFSAALHLGLAARYGGDPAHIRSTPATEPDRDTGLTRNYLVLYDSLPGGTGYLQRLVTRDGEEFRAVLAKAQEHLNSCPCQDGPRRACHRCLLAHAPQRDYPLVDRREALWMLDGLLGDDGHSDWHVTREQADAELRFAAQAESDLERRFIDCLDRWLAQPENGVVRDHRETPTGRLGKQIRLRRADGTYAAWEVIAQKDLTEYGTRPDLLFRPITGETGDGSDENAPLEADAGEHPPPPVAVYLDGYRWHASARTNRIADDAAKRARLRADGMLVWQLTWDDVAAWHRALNQPQPARQEAADDTYDATSPDPLVPLLAGPAADAAWPPYDVTEPVREGDRPGPGARAREKWAKKGREPQEVDTLLYEGAVPSLLGFLRDPDLGRWRDLAVLAVGSFLTLHRRQDVLDADPATAAPWIEAAVRGGHPPAVHGKGLKLLSTQDASGLPLTLVIDGRNGGQRWSALAVLDDRPDAVHGDRPEHRRRWKAWLCWGNILQFLDPTGRGHADGLLLARTALDTFDATLLAATSPAPGGLLTALREDRPGTGLATAPADEEAKVPVPVATPPADVTPVERAAWDAVLRDLSLVGDPGIDRLARELAGRGDVPVGTAGWEVAGVPRTVELAWPDHRIGVVLAEDAADEEYMARCAAAGWHVRPPSAWKPDELVARLATQGHDADPGGGERR
ncbi:DEAD/DEAH box helicase [Streptomyces violaceus]|uniref:DEAD/DEAH box helicase n=1 Tax=Streptomyces violaceus TaxID=1936 RepID=UPI002E2DC6A0|nr:DEAD/DEAH box helicase [Streptomyces violaceus]